MGLRITRSGGGGRGRKGGVDPQDATGTGTVVRRRRERCVGPHVGSVIVMMMMRVGRR